MLTHDRHSPCPTYCNHQTITITSHLSSFPMHLQPNKHVIDPIPPPSIAQQQKQWFCLAAAPLPSGRTVPEDSVAGSFLRRCRRSRRESSCFLCAWMLLHVSDIAGISADGGRTGGKLNKNENLKITKKKVTVRLVDGREWCAVRAEMESGLHPVRERFRLGGAVLRNDSLRSCYLEQMHQYTLATGSVSCISERRISLNFEYKFIGLILGTHQTTYTSGVGQIKSPFPLRRN